MPKGGWIITHTGRHVYPLDFRPDMVDLEDIAHALSNVCRFTGHTPRFYSVAEHSVYVAEEVEKLHGDPLLTMKALLHDADEAYLDDIAQPLKILPEFEFFCAAGKQINAVVNEIFGLGRMSDPRVKLVDQALLAFEGTKFFHDITKWDPAIIEAGRKLEIDRPLHCWPPNYAKIKFIDLFCELHRACTRSGHIWPEASFDAVGEVV